MVVTPLRGRHLRALGPTTRTAILGRITERPSEAQVDTSQQIFLAREPQELPIGFAAVLLHRPMEVAVDNAFVLGRAMHYLADGDVVRLEPESRTVHVLYRKASSSNSFLVTERCDNLCRMCSQPPRKVDDQWLVDELFRAIPLMSHETREVGITGGEPGLLGERLIALVHCFKDYLPTTAVHILSNGRAFKRRLYAKSLAAVSHPDLMVGIPVYSDLPEEHDFVVQSVGAFSETIRGILNLKEVGVRVEVRVVLDRNTVPRLVELARFLARNLVFVDHVALMGLEPVGFARANLDELWLDPLDYAPLLASAVETLDRAGVPVSIYNHPLCVLAPRLWPFARKSISDWKNLYFDECAGCQVKDACGGFFASSAVQRTRGVSPIRTSAGR